MTPFLSKLAGFRCFVRGAMILATLSLVLPGAFGQSEKGSLSGLITDATGAVVAGATKKTKANNAMKANLRLRRMELRICIIVLLNLLPKTPS